MSETLVLLLHYLPPKFLTRGSLKTSSYYQQSRLYRKKYCDKEAIHEDNSSILQGRLTILNLFAPNNIA